ncbi:Nitrogen permease regulator 3, partial [Lobosporangium transversale]
MDLLAVNVNDMSIMNGLVGIIIVTNSSRGHHFVYKYPPEVQSSSNTTDSSRREQGTMGKTSTGDFQVASKVLGYDIQFLANLLSPRQALCDKRFQLTVDDLTFIGHPVSLTGPEFRERRDYWKWKASRSPKHRVKRGWVVGGAAPLIDDSDSDSDGYEWDSHDDSDSHRGSVSGKSTKELIRRGSKEESDIPMLTATRSFTDPVGWRQQRFRSQTYASNPVSPAPSDSPVSGQTPGQQTLSIAHQFGFGSSLLHHPVSMPQTPTGGIYGNFGSQLGIPPPIQITQGSASSLFPQIISTPSTHIQQMSFFHVVFVLKPTELQLNCVADRVYKNIACKLTAALRYEELNGQYVSLEASKILSIREEAAQAVADKMCHVVLNDSIDVSLQIPHLEPSPRSSSYVTRRIQNNLTNDSPTGNGSNGHINSYHSGKNPGSQHALMTPMVAPYGSGISSLGFIMDDYERGTAYEYENFPVLLPYHTLLLLEDPEEILKDIPLDANPTLVKLVQILVPYQ